MKEQATSLIWSILVGLTVAGVGWTAHDFMSARTTRAALERTVLNHEQRISRAERSVQQLLILNERQTTTQEHMKELLKMQVERGNVR